MDKRKYLGTGWSFPVCFDKVTGVMMANNEEDIQQSLCILFSTHPGERPFCYNYGCNLQRWTFSSMYLTEKRLLSEELRQAIIDWEPRIEVEDIQIEKPDEATIHILLQYRVRQTNTRSNMVFPFYLKEGTNL
ncbi:MAG: GPW/gp25 family protein [Tannerellaceae bacterium]|nr:GPW/gp25 family protein [Tannerellaceae bacterium]